MRFQTYRRRANSNLSPIGRGMIWGFSLAAGAWGVIGIGIAIFFFVREAAR